MSRYVLDRDDDLWQSQPSGLWHCLTTASSDQHGGDLLNVCGPLTELVAAPVGGSDTPAPNDPVSVSGGHFGGPNDTPAEQPEPTCQHGSRCGHGFDTFDGYVVCPGPAPADQPEPGAAAMSALLGYDVIESRNVPAGQMIQIGNQLHVRSMWYDLRFPLIVSDVRTKMRADLAALVSAAERRLGLRPVLADQGEKP